MSETPPHVIVIAGANGAGKTTMAPFLLRDELRVLEYVNADPIAHGLAGFDPARVALSATWAVDDNSHLPNPMMIAPGSQGEEHCIIHADLWEHFQGMSQ